MKHLTSSLAAIFILFFAGSVYAAAGDPAALAPSIPEISNGVTAPTQALGPDSDLVRAMARRVSRTLARDIAPRPEADFAASEIVMPQVLPSRMVAPLAATLPAVLSIAPTAAIPQARTAEVEEAPARSKALPILATAYIALNALDAYTTTKAVSSGRGAEANPLLAPVVQSPRALSVAKIAATATTLFVARRLWKRNRVASIAMMVVANVGMAAVVSHNARVAGVF